MMINERRPLTTKPNQTKPNQTKPNQTKPNQTKPNQTKTNRISNVGVNELIHNQSLFIGLPPNGSQALIDVSLPSPPVFAPGYILIPVKGASLRD